MFFQATALFTVILTISTLGADTGLVRYLPRAIAHRRPDDVRATLKISLGPALAFSIVLAIVLALTAGPLGDLATGDSPHLARPLHAGDPRAQRRTARGDGVPARTRRQPRLRRDHAARADREDRSRWHPGRRVRRRPHGDDLGAAGSPSPGRRPMSRHSWCWSSGRSTAPAVMATSAPRQTTATEAGAHRRVLAVLGAARGVTSLLGRTAAHRHRPRRCTAWSGRRGDLHRGHPLPDPRPDVRAGDPAGDGTEDQRVPGPGRTRSAPGRCTRRRRPG